MVIIIKGFKISIGWNLGKNPKLSHLLDPFTSTPKKELKLGRMYKLGIKLNLCKSIYLFRWMKLKKVMIFQHI